MALFTSYAPPGVYTTEVFVSNTASAVGTARIPVILGEGQETFTFSNVELFRGSSPVQDDQSVNENISDQVVGFTRDFQTTFFPVVDGTGKGVTTDDPSKVQVQAIYPNGDIVPVNVISLDGATGQFAVQDLVPAGTDLTVSYFFKRGDTQIVAESLLAQVPSYATLTVSDTQVSPPLSGSLVLSLTEPGEGGNLVTLQFVDSGASPASPPLGVPDAQAVIGAGTNAIAIEIRKTDLTVRTLQDLYNIVNSVSIPTLSGGYLTAAGAVSGAAATPLKAGAAAAFAGGQGPSSNTVFKTQHTPIVDGTNGGVVTTNTATVTVLLNGVAQPVVAVDGLHGLITLAGPVPYGANSFTVTYWTNTWQNTFDLLPSSTVQSIVEVGLGPNRSDYAEDIDYSLGVAYDSNGNVVANTVNWGNNVSEAVGVDAAGDTAFSPSEVLTTLVDEKVWLRPLTGPVNGINAVFGLPDTPTDGSGSGKPTDLTSLVSVYVGTDALEAFGAGAMKVAQLNGLGQTVTLYNPPPAGAKVYATYYRNTLQDQQYTLTVVTPGFSGLGTYTVADNLGRILPPVTNTVNSVAAGGFATTGIVYPNGFPDAVINPGQAAETIKLTFRNDGNSVLVPAVPATKSFTFGAGSLTFTAGMAGSGGNNVQVAFDASSLSPVPIAVAGDLVTVYASWNGALNTLAQIAAYTPTAETTSGGMVTAAAVGSGSVVTSAAASLAGGADAITAPVTHSYTVTSTGKTGSVTAGGANVGYLDQTYIDPSTGFRVTVANPADHVAYGVTSIPASYSFAPGDYLTFSVNPASARYVGVPAVPPAQANNAVCIGGLNTKVVTCYGATAGDTVVVSTVRGTGMEPNIGEYYFVTYVTSKAAADYALRLYTNPNDAYFQYGQPSTVNRVSLGIQLMVQNGVQTFGVIQIPSQPGTNVGAASDYIAALQQLTYNLPGFNRKCDVVVPLSNDPSVHQALSRQLTTQATARYRGEAIGFVGYSQFTTADIARSNARALDSQRMIAVGNAAAGILVTNLTTGVALEYLVDGPFMAAAMAGLNCNPANDVATTLTRQNLTGFSRLLVTYDDPTMNLMAADGLTMLLNNSGALQIRHYKTTDPSNTLVSEPTSTTIADYVAQRFRQDLDAFIGRKLVDSLVTDITVVCNSRLKSLVDQQIITGYQNLNVRQNDQDPTEVDVTVTFKPMFSLLYVSVTFTVQTSL